jgi:hypothetical protein
MAPTGTARFRVELDVCTSLPICLSIGVLIVVIIAGVPASIRAPGATEIVSCVCSCYDAAQSFIEHVPAVSVNAPRAARQAVHTCDGMRLGRSTPIRPRAASFRVGVR